MITNSDIAYPCTDQKAICKEIKSLLDRLNIPLQEQIILWKMGVKEMSCFDFKNMLSMLVKYDI